MWILSLHLHHHVVVALHARRWHSHLIALSRLHLLSDGALLGLHQHALLCNSIGVSRNTAHLSNAFLSHLSLTRLCLLLINLCLQVVRLNLSDELLMSGLRLSWHIRILSSFVGLLLATFIAIRADPNFARSAVCFTPRRVGWLGLR